MGCVSKRWLVLWGSLVFLTLVDEVFTKNVPEEAVPAIGVSIEDFIDLDAPPSSGSAKDGAVLTSQPGSDGKAETTVGHGNHRIVPGLGPAPPPIPVVRSDVIKPTLRHVPITSDDEDEEISGDGSGSGEGPDLALETSTVTLTTSGSEGQESKVKLTMDTPHDLVIGEGGDRTVDKLNSNLQTSEDNFTVGDVMYTADVWPPAPVKEQTDEGNANLSEPTGAISNRKL